MTGVPLQEIVAHLDEYLRIHEVPDDPNALNGLQVENGGTVGSIVAAVDAGQATIDGAVERAASGRAPQGGPVTSAAAGSVTSAPPLLLVHHGVLWDGNVPVTGRRYRRIRTLLDSDVALYAAHIPLDLHPEVGNNVVLAERLGLSVEGWFGSYRGVPIGVWGRAPHALEHREAFRRELGRILGIGDAVRVVPGGAERLQRIGIVTGAASRMLANARDLGLDAFVTGEAPHHAYFDAMEWGLNLVLAGHYATETLGVQALASHLADRFDLPWEFHDHPTGL